MKKILIITGGMITHKESSIISFIKKNILHIKYSDNTWLDTKIKFNFAENIILTRLEGYKKRYRENKSLKSVFYTKDNFNTPELTEVMLMTLIHQSGFEFESISIDDLFSNKKKSSRFLKECEAVFLSTTFLRDISELIPILDLIKSPKNKVIIGGALASLGINELTQLDKLDLVAVGYGEYLVPSICKWISNNYSHLESPQNGRVEFINSKPVLYSGTPDSLNLDSLPREDWTLAEKYYHRKFRMINYESVRGCPYRCAFCNYPYLFDDTKFRTKSAKRIADDWQYYYEELNVEYITCLDSLFTMPKKRLIELCKELIKREVKIKWICYARADDLCDEEVVKLMIKAGAVQVQIGIESADAQVLSNMNKRVTPEKNNLALKNCRTHGLTTVASYVIGFPGESKETLKTTLDSFKISPPDFYFLCTFSTRVPGVPILEPENVEKYKIQTNFSTHAVSPYWQHETMNCQEASIAARKLGHEIINNKLSLDASLFYQGILSFKPEMRTDLLDFQSKGRKSNKLLVKIFSKIHLWINKKLKKDLTDFFQKKKENGSFKEAS